MTVEAASPVSKGGRRRTMVQLFALLVVLALLALLAYGIRKAGAGPLYSGPAPPFTLELFDGGQLSLADLRGQVVVMNIWASWCPTCREEAPVLEKVWRAYRDKGVMFVGVDYLDTELKAREYIAEFDITYPNGPDLGGRIYYAYRARGVPETFFIDKEGNIAHTHIGPLNEPTLTGLIEDLLMK